MRTKRKTGWGRALSWVLLFIPAGGFAVTNDLSTALSKGLFEEEANHNLGAAIKMYQLVIDRFDTDRKLAGTAVFRLGECYRKQGNTNEATAQYQRVLREFADQAPLVTLSRQYLTDLSGIAQSQIRIGQPGSATNFTERLQGIVEVGEISRVQAIIQNSPDLINAPDASGQTLLQTYAGKGDLNVVTFLLDRGAAVNGIKQPDLTPLHFAAGNGRKAIVELLLSKGAKVDAVAAAGVTPLHLAVFKGYELVAKVLLEHGANVNAQVLSLASRSADTLSYSLQKGKTPLHLACQEGYDGLVDLLISKGADLNAQDGNGETPLTVAAQANNVDIAKALVAAGADPNAGRWSALSLASAQGYLPILEVLLSSGTNLNLTNALQMAVRYSHAEVVTRLIHAKANPNAKDEHGEPLVFSALGSTNTLRALLEGGADPQARNTSGEALLHRAVNGSSELVELLFELGVDPNPRDPQGLTPLHDAAQNERLAEARILLKHGANVNVQATYGQTPLHLAVRSRNQEFVTLLLEHGADPNIRDNNGETALDLAGKQAAKPGPPQLTMPGRQPPSPPARDTMQDLLLQHGANADLPRMDRIEVRRFPIYSAPILSRSTYSTNDVNRFSLLELLGLYYGLVSDAPTPVGQPAYDGSSGTLPSALRFPNLDQIEIRRPKPDGNGWTVIPVRVQSILNSGDCSRDVWLQWGDQVEIPESDHPLDAIWNGFSSLARSNLQQCLKRTVRVTVKGQTTALDLQVSPPATTPIPGSSFFYSPAQFCLRPALQRSGLLRSSSDLSRILVKRNNPATGEHWQKTFDCSDATRSPSLWLRDGDVIEVPDKP